jgi:Ser/Thr protein kinase RdoA (MazF antagonist)
MAPGPLRDAAEAIDARLAAAEHPTILHGDAKVANGCFGDGVAMVDFQYTGRGPGVCDVVYFLGSCLDDSLLVSQADRWMGAYLDRLCHHVAGPLQGPLREEARALWPFAWADFERFLAGWAPDHWKRSGYAHQQTRKALAAL